MLPHTDALAQLKHDAQEVHDFIIVACHAVPAYKIIYQEHADAKRVFIPRPDHFPEGQISHDRVRELAKNYKTPLANYALLSLFAFFESYVKDAIKELFKFHGHEYLDSLGNKLKAKAIHTAATMPHKKLSDRPTSSSRGKHLHLIKKLSEIPNSVTPTALFSSFGIKMLRQRMGTDFDKLKAVDIPGLLRDAFLYEFSDADESEFHSIRDKRNSIAHGNSDGNLSLTKVIEYNYFLKRLAVGIDEHLRTHFFIVEHA